MIQWSGGVLSRSCWLEVRGLIPASSALHFPLFCHAIRYKPSAGSLSCVFKSQSARWPQARSGGPDEMPTILPSQGATLDPKSPPGLHVNGPQNCHSHPQKQAQTLSSLISIFIFFVLIILFVVFFYLIINQSNFFLIKLKTKKYFLI